MKALFSDKYGPPDLIRLIDVPTPEPKDNEVLVKIHATTINRTDSGLLRANPFIVRFFMGLFSPRNHIMGSEFAGMIESVGARVTKFKPGDQVFGLSTKTYGTHAQFLCIPETGSIALMPNNLTYEEAAGVCDGMMLAMTYIRHMQLDSQSQVLVNGATGSIGSAGVQIIKHFGAQVTAVGNTKNIELVKSIGADHVIDYLKEDFTKIKTTFDYVFDAVGKSTFGKCKPLLKPGGTYFSTELGPNAQNIWYALWDTIVQNFSGYEKRIKCKFPIPTDNQSDIEFFKMLLETAQYRPIIDRVYPMEQFLEAYQYVETGEKTGNVVLTIPQEE